MAINKFMMAALKALSYPDINLTKNYKIDRALNNMIKPKMKLLYKIWDHEIVFDNHTIPVRIFLPREQIGPELLVFFHGGGWVTGNIDSYTNPCGNLSNYIGRRVISVDYRLAPEFPFPNAVNDCYYAAKEIFDNRELFDIDEHEIVLIGDSAGGNLAAAVSLMARDKGKIKFGRQILIYPATNNDHTDESPFESVHTKGTDYLLTSKKIRDYMTLYVQDEKYRDSPYFAPLLADNLCNQPHTLIITAEFDPLRDEGEEYGKRLHDSGNYVEIYRMKDALHGFFSLPARFTHVKQTYNLIKSFLSEVKCIED